jgi:hypothetical protein
MSYASLAAKVQATLLQGRSTRASVIAITVSGMEVALLRMAIPAVQW